MAPKKAQTKRQPQKPQSQRVLRSAASRHLKPRGCKRRTPLPRSLRWLLSAHTSDTPSTHSSPSNGFHGRPKTPRPMSAALLADYLQDAFGHTRMHKMLIDNKQVVRRIQEILDRKWKAGEVITIFEKNRFVQDLLDEYRFERLGPWRWDVKLLMLEK